MFEDSLVESAGRIRTRSGRWAAGSVLLQTALLTILATVPYLYPDALPPKFLRVPLIAPPPPPAAPVVATNPPAEALGAQPVALDLSLPTRIPHGPAHIVDNPPGPAFPGSIGPAMGNGTNPTPLLNSIAPPPVPLHRVRPAGPMHVSQGVAAGQLIVPIRPAYPAIARAAGVQGTVVVAAIISTEGRIESVRVVSGPPMLVNAAVQAIEQARYRPWMLNGQAVEVETTINVVFRLRSE